MDTKYANKKKASLMNNNDGVSAVIGVILMVAVTVIMAAIIGAFVFGYVDKLLPNQSNQPFGFVVSDKASPTVPGAKLVTIVNNGGIEASGITVSVNGYSTDAQILALWPVDTYDTTTEAWASLQNVGGQVTKIGSGASEVLPGYTITVTGSVNGVELVLATYEVPATV